ncbi:MAG: class I SAM-dependent methyltransferase [Oscillospiraceae bacterium]|nr:class I SAM-dependent methyltransferase [Oscillospiraceae bacterium]
MNEHLIKDLKERYNLYEAAAWIRGHSLRVGTPELRADLLKTPPDELTEPELAEIVEAGRSIQLKLYPFKTGTQELPRVKRTIGFLRSVSFESMLDVGSGRGVFIRPFMEAFPWVRVTSLDLLENRVSFLNELSAGGFSQLHAEQKNICDQPFPENSFDVVTMLEVLEHIPEVDKAIAAAVRMAKKYVVVSVPSRPDDNPEHIHLLTKEILTDLFSRAGCSKLHFDGVDGHLFLVAATPAEMR